MDLTERYLSIYLWEGVSSFRLKHTVSYIMSKCLNSGGKWHIAKIDLEIDEYTFNCAMHFLMDHDMVKEREDDGIIEVRGACAPLKPRQ